MKKDYSKNTDCSMFSPCVADGKAGIDAVTREGVTCVEITSQYLQDLHNLTRFGEWGQ